LSSLARALSSNSNCLGTGRFSSDGQWGCGDQAGITGCDARRPRKTWAFSAADQATNQGCRGTGAPPAADNSFSS
jgi:hypothetical protein